jgi:hypothetical protein
MGLSSSQARLLNLTARMHQIEYKAAKLEAEKLQMSNESNKVYETYLDALEASKVQIKKLTSDGSVTYTDFSSMDELNRAGYSVFIKVGSNWTEFEEGSDMETSLGTINISSLNSKNLQNLIESGIVILKDKDGEETSVATNTGLSEVSDETNLKKAEAQYEADMKRIDAKDTKYDTELAALDTERNAVKSEMETLKSVAKENVERTFKLFS